MKTEKLLAEVVQQGFALRMVGDGISIVGISKVPAGLLKKLKNNKPALVEVLTANPPEIINEPGFVCPHESCKGDKHEVHDAGMICTVCGKMSYLFQGGNIVRTDCA